MPVDRTHAPRRMIRSPDLWHRVCATPGSPLVLHQERVRFRTQSDGLTRSVIAFGRSFTETIWRNRCPWSRAPAPLPALVAGERERAAGRFLEFFTVNICNRNTRTAYAFGLNYGSGVILTVCVLHTLDCPGPALLREKGIGVINAKELSGHVLRPLV